MRQSGSSAAMEQLRAALAEIAVMRRDGLLTDEEVRARDQPSCARGAMLRPCAREKGHPIVIIYKWPRSSL